MFNTLIEWDEDANEEIVVTLKAAALFNRVNKQLPGSVAETLWCKLGDAEVQTTYGGCCLTSLVPCCHPLISVKIEAISVVLGEVQASKVVYAWVGTVSRVEIRIVHYTVGQLKAKALTS